MARVPFGLSTEDRIDRDGADLLTETTLHHAYCHLKRLLGLATAPETTLTLEVERLDFPPHR